MAEPVGVVQYFPWDGGAVFVGTGGIFPAHAHQAIQICFLFDGAVRLRTNDAEPWRSYEIAVVPSQREHAMDASGTALGAMLFVEPETREGRALTELHLRAGAIAALDRPPYAQALEELRAAFVERREHAAVVAAARGIVRALTRERESAALSDERILRAVRYVNEHLAEPLTLGQVAAVAFLSPSRFRHLFAEQTGMGLRQYILWRRFISVWELRMKGVPLADAAHAAGFADSAHLARTSRRMIGIPPSLMDLGRVAAAAPEH